MISAIVLTRNEERNILECVRSLAWCDEIIIVDDYSEDKTIKIAEELRNKKIRIFKRHLQNNFSEQRNFGLEKARGEWVLFVDADERISSSLQFEIVSTINSAIENHAGYYIKRKDSLWGRIMRYGETGNIKFIRLGKKKAGTWSGAVHETWELKGKIGELNNHIIHYPHQQLSEFLKEINFYTDIRAYELFSRKIRVTSLTILLYPAAKFLRNYLFRLGILDGIPGLLLAVSMSLHSFLVRGKLWLLWERKKSY